VAAAESAVAGADARAIDDATARALEGATIAGCGVNVRGLRASNVASALVAAGVDAESANLVESLLMACEAARFSAASTDDAGSEARERWQRARAVIGSLAGRT
jgi:hypothetical protein